MKPRWLRRPNSLLLASANLIAILTLYFAVPISTDISVERILLDMVLCLLGVAGVSVVLVREARALQKGDSSRSGLHLVLMFEVVVVIFAFLYYVIAVNESGQFSGLETRIDSLYFTMTTMTTVGYGDIHASGQLARVLTTANMAFNLAFLAAVTGLVRARVEVRATKRSDPDTRP